MNVTLTLRVELASEWTDDAFNIRVAELFQDHSTGCVYKVGAVKDELTCCHCHLQL